MKKLYERDGRRFVAATNHTGYYLNEDYTLSKQKTEKSIAICVLHTVSEMIFCELNDNPPLLSWSDAKEYCSKQFLGNGRLPEIHELLVAKNCFRNIFPKFGFIWSSIRGPYNTNRCLNLRDDFVYYDYKDSANQVFAFLKLPI